MLNSIDTKYDGSPVLSADKIDAIGEQAVREYYPDVINNPAPVDIESFIESELGLTMDYQFLSHNGVYLGMTVFNDTEKVIIYSPETKRAEYIGEKAGTVIIDSSLLEKNQEHRFRFTAAHECGHWLFHRKYYGRLQNSKRAISDAGDYRQCRRDATQTKRGGLKTTHDWLEWHANRFASAFLMPKTSILNMAKSVNNLDSDILQQIRFVYDIAYTFNVSEKAARYRLNDLGVLSENTIDLSIPNEGQEPLYT